MVQIWHDCDCGVGQSCSPDLTPSPGTSIGLWCSPKKKKKEKEKSPTLIVFLPVLPFTSLSIYFIYLDAAIWGTYMLMSVISSYCINPLIIL